MAERTRPPFRADHVGSLIRPQELRDARQAWFRGHGCLPRNCTRSRIGWISEAGIAMQEHVGLQAITDGEFRRTSFREVLFESIDGFSKERVETDFSLLLCRRQHAARDAGAEGVSRLRRSGSMAAG